MIVGQNNVDVVDVCLDLAKSPAAQSCTMTLYIPRSTQCTNYINLVLVHRYPTVY